MMHWLMRRAASPSMVDGILAYQITGNPLPALVAIAAPALRARLANRRNDHA
jgi:hypothetical protein